MDKFKIVMTGTIRADDSSMLAVAPISPEYEKNITEKYVQGDSKTARLPRMAKYFEVIDGEQVNRLLYVPYFPASSIRGAIRRACRNVIFDIIGDNKWGLELHRLLTIGGVSTSGPEGDININAIREFRNRNPLISLFGATSGQNNPWIEGFLSIGHAIPSNTFIPPIVTGVRTDPLRRNPAEITMLDDASAAALDDICNAGRTASKLKRQIDDLNAEIKKAKKFNDNVAVAEKSGIIEELTEKFQIAAEISGTSVSIQLPLSGYEVIPPSLPMSQRIVARGITMIELGLLVAGLRRFAKDPLLGAHQAHGCGIARCEWDVVIGDIKGKVILEPFVGMIVENDKLTDLLVKAEEKFNSWTVGCTEKSLLPA